MSSQTPPRLNPFPLVCKGIETVFVIQNERPSQFQFSVFHKFLNVEFCIGLQSDDDLALVVKRSIVTAIIKIDTLHGSRTAKLYEKSSAVIIPDCKTLRKPKTHRSAIPDYPARQSGNFAAQDAALNTYRRRAASASPSPPSEYPLPTHHSSTSTMQHSPHSLMPSEQPSSGQ